MKYLLLLVFNLALINQSLFAQQASEIEFIGISNGYGPKEIIYVKSLNKALFKGKKKLSDINYDYYSYDFNTNQLNLEIDIDSDEIILLSPDETILYGFKNNATNDNTIIRVYSFPTLNLINEFITPLLKWAGDITISPSNPQLLLLRYQNTVINKPEIALCKNGIMLTNVHNPFKSYGSITFSQSNNKIFIADLISILSFEYDNNGINSNSQQDVFRTEEDFFKMYDDKIYLNDGSIINVKDSTLVKYEGRFGLDIYASSIFFDPLKNQLIKLKDANSGSSFGEINLYYYDSKTYVLLDKKSIYLQSKERLASSKNYFQIYKSASFVVLSGSGLIIVRDNCDESQIVAPELDSKYNEPVRLCLPDTVKITPPTGYTAIFDEQNINHDTLCITLSEANKAIKCSYKLMNSEGCLSPLSKPITITSSYTFDKPKIYALHDKWYYYSGTIERCTNGKAYFTTDESNDVRQHIWSTGEFSKYISVPTDTIVWVKSISRNGCESPHSDTIRIIDVNKITPPPPRIFNNNFNNHIWNGRQLELTPEGGYSFYNWIDLEDNENFNSNRQFITNESTIYLQGKSAEGCWSDYTSMYIQEHSENFPSTYIIRKENYLTSNTHFKHYQWMYNGQVIPNNDKPFLEAKEPGTYSLSLGNGVVWGNPSSIIIE